MMKIVYASVGSADLNQDDLVELLVSARITNARNLITGMLVYSSGTFMQYFEGPDQGVKDLFAQIEQDDRHHDIRLLTEARIRTRSYPSWWMGFAHPDDLTLAESIPGFKASLEFPLVHSNVITDGTVAETILAMYASNPTLGH